MYIHLKCDIIDFMKKLLIVDGCSLLFQSFYGMPKKIQNQQGEYVEAVICFMGILFKIIRMINPTHVFVVFDGETKLERKDFDTDYKANRQDFSNVEDIDNPFIQLEIIKKVLSYINIQWFETFDCEADDLIASVIHDNKDKFEIIVSSQDKDFFQLICENVNVFVYRGKVSKLWTEAEINNKFGFDAKHFSTFKALVGDNSDNIKGINGIGCVTASKLIQQFGDLINIYNNIDQIAGKLNSLLKEHKEKAFLNFKIIELHSKTNLFNLPNCKFILPEISSTELLKNLNIL